MSPGWMIGSAIGAWLLGAALCLPLAASPGAGFTEQIEVEWVLVPALVRTPSGYVRGLERRDFVLTIDGRPVEIESFEASSDAPVSLIHLQDLSGSMALGDKLEASRRLLSCVLDRFRSGDEVAVATFAGGRIRVEVPFTAETAAVREAMAAWRGYGTTALHDAVAFLPDIAVRDHGVKRAALILTDGVDNASVLSPGKARGMVRQAQLPVYVVGLSTGSPFELDRRGSKPNRYADVLNLLAHLTGGGYHSIVGAQDVDAVCTTVLEDLRSQYVLGFATSAEGPRRYRPIEVEVPGRKATVLHRRGYVGRRP